MEPTLRNVLEQRSLKWIFVGGKGGVGKTTTSCSLAVQLAAVRRSVLLISTDPAHNLSDAFSQKFGRDPTPVAGVPNLHAMEIDPSAGLEELGALAEGGDSPMGGLFSELSMALPGVDEAMGFAQVMKLLRSMDYDVVVFDTAPTGHTLRFLSFPSVLERALGKLSALSGSLGPALSGVLAMLGGGGAGAPSADALFGRLSELLEVVREVNRQFSDASLTTFVCVCIAEFLSLYETERMVQDLAAYRIDAHNVVVNQLVPRAPAGCAPCGLCGARRAMQRRYLEQILELYEDFHVVQLPLLRAEVRGADAIRAFSSRLMDGKSADDYED